MKKILSVLILFLALLPLVAANQFLLKAASAVCQVLFSVVNIHRKKSASKSGD